MEHPKTAYSKHFTKLKEVFWKIPTSWKTLTDSAKNLVFEIPFYFIISFFSLHSNNHLHSSSGKCKKPKRERLLFLNVRVRILQCCSPTKTAINGASYSFKKLFKVFENYLKVNTTLKSFQENILTLSNKNSREFVTTETTFALPLDRPAQHDGITPLCVVQKFGLPFPSAPS